MPPDISKQTAFMTGRILHQGTGEPILGQIKITAREGAIVDKVLEDGRFVISGQLNLLFPNLSSQPYQLHLTIRADSPQFRRNFIEYSRLATIPVGSNFEPNSPTLPTPLIDLGDIHLPVDSTVDPKVFRENMQVNIRGRAVRAKDPTTPISGARIEVRSSGAAPITSSPTGSDGRYRLDNIIVKSPATILCFAPGFTTTVPRILSIDYSRFIHEEYFRLQQV